MKKKNILLIIAAVLLGAVLLGVFIKRKSEENRIIDTANAYRSVNIIFIGTDDGYYLPFQPDSRTPDGIFSRMYLRMAYYRQQTGAEFYYEDVLEYLSQEYEEDGSLRLYNNGFHPEMELYIEWVNNYFEEGNAYIEEISRLHGVYYFAHRDEGFESSPLYTWSRAILDELIKKEADPEYEMDLLSIQQRERAEA